MTTATMFYGFGVVTTIDYATIDHLGRLVGGSMSPAFEIRGEVDTDEQVVIDFSTCKKQIKSIIDDKVLGIDHKLVIGPWTDKNISVVSDGKDVNLKTKDWDIVLPANAIHFAGNMPTVGSVYDNLAFAEVVSKLVNTELVKTHPSVTVDVFCNQTIQRIDYSVTHAAPFRYVHGLKSSTSWGCQNIAHGHYSYVTINAEDEVDGNLLAQKIASDLNDTVFVYDKNIINHWDSRLIQFGYKTERGEFKMTQTSFNPKIMILPVETTVENLAEQIWTLYAKELKDVGTYELIVSEGLSKGAIYRGGNS